MRELLSQLTFGTAALSLGMLLAFIVMRGDFEGMNAGAGTILFGFLLAAFVLAPFVMQHFVNKRVRSRSGAGFALAGLVAMAGLGLVAYGTVLFSEGDALDAVAFMALPLWQALIIGLAYGAKTAVSWYKRQSARNP